MDSDLVEIFEGSTKLLVPRDSLIESAPPKQPAFFNPRAKINRDFSMLAYSSFLKKFKGPKILLDSLAGIGARSIRAANEIMILEKVIANDINPSALEIAKKIADLNHVTKCNFSENEACRFLSLHSQREERGGIVEIDPFGSPSRFLDCGLRATCHGGLLSITATDLTVLNGIFPEACRRKYYGTPVRTEYGNEIALRLILGCINLVAGRLDMMILPLFVQNNMHYYKVYTKVLVRTNAKEEMGYILHCDNCGNRRTVLEVENKCNLCNLNAKIAGPLWIGSLYEKEFVNEMLTDGKNFKVDKSCVKILEKCQDEFEMPAYYFTIDEIARRKRTAPLSLERTVKKLQNAGYKATRTSMNPSAIKTNAAINEILSIV